MYCNAMQCNEIVLYSTVLECNVRIVYRHFTHVEREHAAPGSQVPMLPGTF